MAETSKAPPVEVLIASDFSARADRPLERALRLAEAWRARLAIAHVLEDAVPNLAETTARLRAELPPAAAQAEFVVRVGSAPTVLADLAVERGSAVIITGVARFNSLGDYVTGTAVDHIVRHASVPVLVVRKRAERPYDRILVATDFSECSRAALLAAAALFPTARLVLLHVNPQATTGRYKVKGAADHLHAEAAEDMAEFLAAAELPQAVRDRIEPVLDDGAVVNVIKRQVQETGVSLVVVGAHRSRGLVQDAIGSHAEGVLRGVDADVLLVREA